MIAIDFGTYGTCAAWINPRFGQAEVLPNLDGESTTPSVAYFGRDEVVVGRPALAMVTIEEEQPRIVLGAKRHLMQATDLAVPGREVKAASVAVELFRKIKCDAERDVFRTEIARVVVTHPASLGQTERDTLRTAATSAGFSDVTLLEEPVAAALAYDRNAGDVGDHLLVCDLGAREFNFAVLSRTEEGLFRLALPPRTLHVGGDDFDRQLYDHCDLIAQKELGRSIDPKGGIDISILLACRRQKEVLSDRQRSEFSAYLPGGVRLRHQLDRATFEGLVRGHAELAARMARSLFDDAIVQECTVETVLLIGGSARIPLIQQFFEKAIPLRLSPWPQQDTAVALGAAYFGDRDSGRSPDESKVRVQVRTSLSDIIYRVESREADERKRMAADKQQQQDTMRKRVLDVFTTKANATESEQKRLRHVLAQYVANREHALAQETLSALLRVTPDDTELQKAQRFLDTHHQEIGEVREIGVGGDGLSIAISNDGLLAAVGTAGNQVVFCDLVAGTTVKSPLVHGNHIPGVSLTPDMQHCITGCRDGKLRRWSVDEAKETGVWSHGGVVRSVLRMADGQHMSSGGEDSKIKLWKIEDMSVVCTLEGHTAAVNSLDGSPDGSRMISSSADQSVRVWDVSRARDPEDGRSSRRSKMCPVFSGRQDFGLGRRRWDIAGVGHRNGP
jgi:hypothetical protein